MSYVGNWEYDDVNIELDSGGDNISGEVEKLK